MVVSITPIYAALAGLVYFVLSVNAAFMRRRHRIPIGDGGNELMLRAVRIHANFAEYVPLTLLLLLMMELQGVAPGLIHAGATCLLAGRVLHAFGVRNVNEDFRFRVAGMSLTFTSLIGSCCAIIGTAILD